MRLITKLWATLLLLCVAGVANAATEYEIDQKFTSVAALDGQLFVIYNETDQKAIFNVNNQNLDYASYTEAVAGTAYLWKLHSLAEESDANVQNAYAIEVVKADGSSIGLWGNPAIYLNSGAEGGFDGCFVLGNKDQYGTDVKYGGAWEIEYAEGQGFALKNVARGGYFAGVNPAPTGTDPIYWTLCTMKEAPQTDPLAEQKDALTAAIATGKMYFAVAYTEATFSALSTAITDGEAALAAEGATAESLTNATTAINNAIAALALKDGFTSLKDVDFGVFDGWGATATLTQKLDPIWDLFKATGQSYGDPSVNNRADVSAYDKLYVVAVSGSPRILLNRDADGGQWSETEAESHLIDNTKGGWSAKYFSTENGITTVDLKQLVADKGFAHLTAIKSFDNNVISGLYLYKAPAVVPVDPTVVTWDATVQNYENQTEISTIVIDEKINAVFDKNTNNNGPKYYTNGTAVRVYGGNTITISGEKVAISKVEFTFGSSDGTNDILADKGTYAEGVWTISENTNIVKFTIGGTTGNRRIAAIKVTYAIDENAAPLPQPVHIANTAETAYTVAEAVGLIDAGEALSETVFVKGIVSQVDKIQGGAITYWISADGTTEGQQFECYKGKNIDGADFAAIEDVEVGAEVIVKGTMTKYGEVYEFNQGNELVSYKAPFKPLFADGKYYIYNVGAQKYLAAGANWGTHAVVNADGLDYIITATDGKYTLDSQVSNGGNNHFLNGEWNDGAAMGWTFAPVEGAEGVYTISDGTNFLTAQDNGEVTLAADATAAAAQWTLKTLEARIAELATATAEAPVNATFLIQDANFCRNDLRKSAWTMEASNQNLSGGNNTNNNAESYHSVFTLSQVLTNVPKGVYTLTAQGFYRQDGEDNENLPVFFANDYTQTFPLKTGSENSMSDASASFSNGNYTIDPIYFQLTEAGDLTVGAKLENNANLWCIWDNFQLTYYGVDADLEAVKNAAIIKELADLRAKAEALKAEVEVDAVKTAIDEALGATAEVSGADAINTAIATMKAVIEKADVHIAAKAALDGMANVMAGTNVYTAEAFETYNGIYETAKGKYQAGELTKDDVIENPEAQMGWHSANSVDDLLLSAWTIGETQCKDYDAGMYINTWSVEGNNDGSNFKVPFFEYWTGDGESLGERTLTATMNGLEAGDYDVTAWVRVRAKNGYTAPAYGISLQANDGEAVDVAAGDQIGESQFYLKEFTARGTVAEDGVLKIQFNVAADNNISWLSFKNVKFEKYVVEVAHTWNFTKWSEATVTNLKAEAAKGYTEGLWSDSEKADGSASTTEISKDNCFWQVGTSAAEGETLTANGEEIAELKGLIFKNNKARSLAIAVNYGDCTSANGDGFGPYHGASYLWLGSKNIEYFTIKNVKAGTQIKMGVESHKLTDARGVQLLIGETVLTDPEGAAVAAPTTYTEQTWAVPGEEGVVDVVVKNTNGCHIYFIDAEIGEADPYVPEEDPDLVEIPQDQGKTLDDFVRTELVEGDDYNTYTCTEGIQVAFKMFDIDVKDCDYVVVKFAEPVAAGWELAFWGKNDQSTVAVPEGATEFKYVFAEDAKCAIVDDVLPQICMLHLWTGTTPLVAKVKGVYKHKVSGTDAINTINTAIQNGNVYNLNGQKVQKAQRGLYIINGKKVVIK